MSYITVFCYLQALSPDFTDTLTREGEEEEEEGKKTPEDGSGSTQTEIGKRV